MTKISALLLLLLFSQSSWASFNEAVYYADQAAREQAVDRDLVVSVIAAESSFRPMARSNRNARGYMQLLPSTAREYCGVPVSQIYNPEDNISCGTKYLRHLLDTYGSEQLALAAYNAGEDKVNEYRGIPPFQETENYVRKVLSYRQQMKNNGGLTEQAGTTTAEHYLRKLCGLKAPTRHHVVVVQIDDEDGRGFHDDNSVESQDTLVDLGVMKREIGCN